MKNKMTCSRFSSVFSSLVNRRVVCFKPVIKYTQRSCHSLKGTTTASSRRFNQINIQMLSDNLFRQIFGTASSQELDEKSLKMIIAHLSKHNLWKAKTTVLPDVDLKLPQIKNSNIVEHFYNISTELVNDYRKLILNFIETNLPQQPKCWKMAPGWTRYGSGGTAEPVSFPDDSALVFDVEVCMQEGNYPTIATAVSDKYWYLWCSERLTGNQFSLSNKVYLSDLIPLETNTSDLKFPCDRDWKPRVIVGHNVAFDRSFIKEQYFLEQTKTVFVDTMSLHVCVSGLTGLQRAMSLASRKNTNDSVHYAANPSMGWSHISSLNNLADVYSLYCKGTIKKSVRDLFVSGSLEDVKSNFQEAASYCAQDSWATFQVLKKLMPMFQERFPHPATLYGLLEMCTAYLPVNQNWERYLEEVQSTYNDLQKELKQSLVHLANDACSLLHNEEYKSDPWLWNLDWSTRNIEFLKPKPEKKSTKRKKKVKDPAEEDLALDDSHSRTVDLKEINDATLDPSLLRIHETAASLKKIRPFLPGYPAWYRELWDRKSIDTKDWEPGPYLISTQMRCVPKLMRMTWDGFPLHHDAKHGWGYLVPTEDPKKAQTNGEDFPIRNFLKLFRDKNDSTPRYESDVTALWPLINEPKEKGEGISEMWNLVLSDENVN